MSLEQPITWAWAPGEEGGSTCQARDRRGWSAGCIVPRRDNSYRTMRELPYWVNEGPIIGWDVCPPGASDQYVEGRDNWAAAQDLCEKLYEEANR